MSAFIDISDEDQLKQLIQFIGERLDSGKDFVDAETAKLSSGDLSGVVKALINNTALFFKGETAHSALNSLARLTQSFKPEVSEPLVLSFAEKLADPELKEAAMDALRVLATLFNNLDNSARARFAVFDKVLTVAARADRVEAVYGQLDKLDKWVVEWSCTPAETRKLYQTVYDMLVAADKREDAGRFLNKYLKTFENASDAELSGASKDVAALLSKAVAVDDLSELESLASLKVVQHLKGQPVHDVLSLVLSGNVDELEKLPANAFADAGVDADEMKKRIRVTSLARLCAQHQTLDFPTIATSLKVDIDDVEEWIIEVVHSGLVEATVDEVEGTVSVTRANQTNFGDGDWKDILDTLKEWQSNIREIQQTLDQAKLQVQRESSSK